MDPDTSNPDPDPGRHFYTRQNLKLRYLTTKFSFFKSEPRLNPEITRYLATGWLVRSKISQMKKNNKYFVEKDMIFGVKNR